MDERGDFLTIGEAATLLGVHRNTVRNRIKAGRYKAHKVVTPQGETYAVARISLVEDAQTPTNQGAQAHTTSVRHNAPDPSQAGSLVSPEREAQADAVVQRLLAPFIAEQTRLAEELGAVKAERDELRRRAEAAEAEAATLRARAVLPRPALVGSEWVEEPQHAPVEPMGPSRGLRARLGRWWWGAGPHEGR